MTSNVGLVFSGGGGKGAYEIGVWRALEEFNVRSQIRVISGCSVGALNAALFAQGDLALAEKLWREMTENDVLHSVSEDVARRIAAGVIASIGGTPSLMLYLVTWLRTHGIFSREGLLKLMKENLDATRITNGERTVFATCRRSGSRHIRHFSLVGANQNRMEKILLASSAIPIVFPTEEIDGDMWLDGGFPSIEGSNTPIQPVYEAGCRVIIVVLLDMHDIIDTSPFPNAEIIYIYPQKSNGGILNGTLDFFGVNADRRMDQGYADTVRVLEPIYQMGTAQNRLGAALEESNYYQKEFDIFRARFTQVKAESDNAKADTLRAIEGLRNFR